MAHDKFGCDLQNSFEENAKEMRYCNATINVISDVLRDRVGGLSKTLTDNKTFLINQTLRIYWMQSSLSSPET